MTAHTHSPTAATPPTRHPARITTVPADAVTAPANHHHNHVATAPAIQAAAAPTDHHHDRVAAIPAHGVGGVGSAKSSNRAITVSTGHAAVPADRATLISPRHAAIPVDHAATGPPGRAADLAERAATNPPGRNIVRADHAATVVTDIPAVVPRGRAGACAAVGAAVSGDWPTNASTGRRLVEATVPDDRAAAAGPLARAATGLAGRRLFRAASVLAAVVVAALVAPASAGAAAVDRTPPVAPVIVYASGLKWLGGCLPLTIGIQRTTDNVTPQLSLVYEVFADGVRLGSLRDNGANAAVWGTLHFRRPGPQTVTARAVDAAGNRSTSSNADVVTAYGC
ncbi:hypothetical protein OWR29_13060 [Actinoplanes sp. Pm04-4]|uniref:Uncharacterized protein n=1 Tax=Paractinoplanes pyxinae TaxID=2997416 RepID=A0ABT4AXI0_9ACTN|nr:hypothetical protein [Actinoplanes pyxinae]MCY1138931.1 hypothetical protein [Actinoplanes pyxinae]